MKKTTLLLVAFAAATSASQAAITFTNGNFENNTWSTYDTLTVQPGETLKHVFPVGFHAHWVRVKSNTATVATAQFTYGPADSRDAFMDWGRDQGLPTAAGRAALAASNSDGDLLDAISEFVFGTDPKNPNPWPITVDSTGMTAVTRNLGLGDGIAVEFQSSTDLKQWSTATPEVVRDPDQTAVTAGFTRHHLPFRPLPDSPRFARIRIQLP